MINRDSFLLHWLLCSLPFLTMLVAVLALCGPDGQAFFFFRDHRYLNPEFRRFMAVVSNFSAPALYFWYGLILLRALRANSASVKNAGKRFILRFVTLQVSISFLLVRAVKIFIGKPRPDVTDGLGLFQPFSLSAGHNSFPSGHTAEITGCILPLALRYRSPLLSLALGCLGALVAFTRIYLAKHFPSDVFFGWVIGSVSGLAFHLWAGPFLHPQPRSTGRSV